VRARLMFDSGLFTSIPRRGAAKTNLTRNH
jgi:hypothetical protein